MMGTPRILVVLSEQERELFFPGELKERLAACVPESAWIFPTEDRRAFQKIVRQDDPQVLVGAWAMPGIDEETLEACPGLTYFCYVTGSVRARMPRAFWERGGVASNWGNTISRTIAECALALTLGCLRQAPRFFREMQAGASGRDLGSVPPRSLFNRRVGLHGFGSVARELQKLLAPFEVQLEAWSEPVPAEIFAQAGVRQAASLIDLFAHNDIIIDVEALTPQTAGSVNAAVIAAMRPGTVFVNVGRGQVIDETALARRAATGDISVGLDVYAVEPLPDESPLRTLSNAMLFPHTAGPTVDCYPICGRAALENLEAYLAKKPLPQAFTLDMLDRAT